MLFATYFFLADGDRIWAWVVRLFPRAARARADSSGRVAWISLTQFVRATVLVALTDAIGIMIVARDPRGAVRAARSACWSSSARSSRWSARYRRGTVAVLVALVAQGPVVALLMLGGVVVVQQLEAHVLQPFLLGRLVSVHPLGVIVAIALGVLVAGIAGALVAVPLAAAVNAVVQHLVRTPPGPSGEADEQPLGDAPDLGLTRRRARPAGSGLSCCAGQCATTTSASAASCRRPAAWRRGSRAASP